MSINDVTFGMGRGGWVIRKVTRSNGEGGFSLFDKPKVTSCTVGHFGGGEEVSQKVTKSDGGGGRPIK